MSAADGWEGYWRSTREAAAHKAGGPQDEVLARFWTGFFESTLPNYPYPRLLDVGCGNGAVVRFVFDTAKHLGIAQPSVYGLDRSSAALTEFHKRFPSSSGIVADARQMPFGDGVFDLVASQFGVEYAGIDAIGHAARLVAPNGVLAAILHLKNGAIFRECAINLEAMTGVRDNDLLARAKQVFRTGMAANTARGSKAAFRRADAKFATAVAKVEDILRNKGNDVTGGVVHELYIDIAHMYGRMSAYSLREVSDWIDQMAVEMELYIGRMSSMLKAAIDETELDRMLQLLGAQGLRVRVRETMHMGERAEAAAWALVCDRR